MGALADSYYEYLLKVRTRLQLLVCSSVQALMTGAS